MSKIYIVQSSSNISSPNHGVRRHFAFLHSTLTFIKSWESKYAIAIKPPDAVNCWILYGYMELLMSLVKGKYIKLQLIDANPKCYVKCDSNRQKKYCWSLCISTEVSWFKELNCLWSCFFLKINQQRIQNFQDQCAYHMHSQRRENLNF